MLKILEAVRKHWLLVVCGVFAGVVLSFLWLYEIHGSRLALRSAGTYTSNVRVVIDTNEFGIGRTDTDMYRLGLVAPTYAGLMTSQPVMSRAAKILGGPVGAEITAVSEGSQPIVTLTVEGADRDRLARVAQAVVAAFQEYMTEQQDLSKVPQAVRLTVRGMGQPSKPAQVSNRRSEIGLLIFLLPVLGAAVLAYRMDEVDKVAKLVGTKPPTGDGTGNERTA